MQRDIHKNLIAPAVDDLINDFRLARLFLEGNRHCALQLWVLQIKSDESTENRIVYGRLLPYSHSENNWSSSDHDNFRTVGQVQLQVVRLNLYVISAYCADLLRRLSAGRTISEISEEFKLKHPDNFMSRFGKIALSSGLVYRPTAYLINRDAHERYSISSPHGGAGAFSASIIQTEKTALFLRGEYYDPILTASVIKQLNEDTGLDFGGADMARLGDIELLVFPTLDELERPLFSVSWADTPHTLVARFNSTQMPHFCAFRFRLSIFNGEQIVYAGIKSAERDGEVFVCKFILNNQLRAMTDSSELEIFGFQDEHSNEGTLCFRWRISYVREIHINANVIPNSTGAVKFDWLEKTTRPSTSARLKSALAFSQDSHGFTDIIGGRKVDPWLPINSDLASILSRLHPPKSDGRFFLRWSQGDGEGRLQFVEWFRALFNKYRQNQVVIFDPYFESAGLGLVLLCSAPKSDYIVFTSLSTPRKCQAAKNELDNQVISRTDNLVASCERSRQKLSRIKLRIYGLKEGRLHDRYILIAGSDGLPIAGYNLSNSLQMAAEKYPLLITPIPADALLEVEKYKSTLIQEAQISHPEDEASESSLRLLFDSSTSPISAYRHEPLRFLQAPKAGDVLSTWAGEPSIRGLYGDPLRERMLALGLLKDDSLVLTKPNGLERVLELQGDDYKHFISSWDVLSEVLANSPAGDDRFSDLKIASGFLAFLSEFLSESFNRTPDQTGKELSLVDARLFRNTLDAMLHSPYSLEHLFHPVKYTPLTWAEYFAIKILWECAPDALLAITEAQIIYMPADENSGSDFTRLALLSQIVSEISLSAHVDLQNIQCNLLLRSKNGLLQWIGLNTIEQQQDRPEGRLYILQLADIFPHHEQVQIIGWMVHRAAKNTKKTQIYRDLISTLHAKLPEAITKDDLIKLINSMRGHMERLSWAEPWLFEDVIYPLLEGDRISVDDACDIWVMELLTLLGPQQQVRLFNRSREGQTTNVAAYLFARSSKEQQQISLKLLHKILRQQRRVVQKPLASTSDWARWNDALMISMWILSFTLWGEFHLRGRGAHSHELNELSRDAHDIIVVRPIEEWQLMNGELVEFFYQAKNLLIESMDKDQ